MTSARSLYEFPIHLGLGAKAIPQPEFTGMEWYDAYVERHANDLDEGRLVGLYRFEESWTSWEMHPAGDELVFALSGAVELVLQEAGGDRTIALGAGEGTLVPKGVWHTARVRTPGHVLHVTPGTGTQHRPL